MRPAADRFMSAILAAVRASGLVESMTRQGVVTAVGSDGTVTVTRNDSTYPKVRRLSGYTSPAVNDRVMIQKTASGWICLGKLMTS